MSETCRGCAFYEADWPYMICHVQDRPMRLNSPHGCEKWREGFWHRIFDVPMYASEEEDEE